MPTFGSLFSGIGGMDLGLERAGWKVRWQVESDPYCGRVLEKHWPGVRRYEDIRSVDFRQIGRVDLIAGGFPCQPVSLPGKRAGNADDRWLWPEFRRSISVLRPRHALIENVPGLLSRGMEKSLETWPRSGIWRNGRLFPRAPWVLHTHAKGCSLWPTPTKRDGRTVKGGRDRKRAPTSGKSLTQTLGEMFGWPPGRVHPSFLEWLMGFPAGWTETADSETPSCRKSRNSSEGGS